MFRAFCIAAALLYSGGAAAKTASEACKLIARGESFVSCPEDLTARVRDAAYPVPAEVTLENGVMTLRGSIKKETADTALALLETAPPFLQVRLDSPGGSPDAAIRIGRKLREKKARVTLEDGALCLSACNFVYMGGLIREAQDSAVFGAHAFDLRCMKREHQHKIAQLAEQETRYAYDMGVSKCFIPEVMFNHATNSLYCVSPEERARYNIDNAGAKEPGKLPPCEADITSLMEEIKQIVRSVKKEAIQEIRQEY